MLLKKSNLPFCVLLSFAFFIVGHSLAFAQDIEQQEWSCQSVDGESICSAPDSSQPEDASPVIADQEVRDLEIRAPTLDRERLDWLPKSQLTFEQRGTCQRGCDGAYVEPERNSDEFEINPTDAKLFAEAGATELNALTQEAILSGGVVFNQGWRQVTATTVNVNPDKQEYRLDGEVSIREPGLLVVGDSASVSGEDNSLVVTNATYLLHNTRLRGSASEVRREGNEQFVIDSATYTSCEPGADAWILRSGQLRINEETGVASGRNVLVRTAGIPIFYAPYISFPIDDRPRSGLLFPTVKLASEDGTEVQIPILWSLAPNQDFTFSPRFIEDRGSGLELEHRFLSKSTLTQSNGGFFPEDRSGDNNGLFDDESRWFIDLAHQGFVKGLWTEVEITRTSDIDFFEDFSSSVLEEASISNLRQFGSVGYQNDVWSFSVLAENFQSLVVDNGNEYQRLPEFEVNGEGFFGSGVWWELNHQLSVFDHALDDDEGAIGFELAEDGTFVTGQRLRTDYQIGWLSEADWYRFQPSLGVDYLLYELDDPLAGQTESSPSELAPNASVNFGLIFERNTRLFGQNWTQTLEPELFYFIRDAGDQADIPLFDTTIATTSYEQLFRRNTFVGGDRVSDNHQITVGLSSRFFSQETGREFGKFRIAQAYNIGDREVTASDEVLLGLTNPALLSPDDPLFDAALAGEAVLEDLASNQSDLIATLDLSLSQNWDLNSELVLNASDSSLERTHLQFAYEHPSKRQSFGLSYFREEDVLFLRDQNDDGFSNLDELEQENVEQASFTGQLAVGDHWTLVTRWQQDLANSRNLDGLVGLSYDNCCWSTSLTWRRWLERDDSIEFVTDTVMNDNGIFFSFEWKGLGGIGQTPRELLEAGLLQ